MAKKVEVEIDVKDNIEASIANLKALKKELKSTAAGSEEFQKLQQSINDMEDSIKSAKTGASNFTEVLGQLPGPIGEIGNKVSGAVNTLKQFGGLKLTDIKQSFTELKKDFSEALSGLGKLTGITKIYTTLNQALSKSFVAVGVGEEAAAIGAKALSAALVATGIGALVVALGLAYNALSELVTGEEEAKRATEAANRAFEEQSELLSLDLADSARRGRKRLADLKAQGATEAELRKEQRDQLKEQFKLTATALEENQALQKKMVESGTGDLKKVQDEETKLLQKQKDIKADIYVSEKEDIIESNKAKETEAEKAAAKAKQIGDKNAADRKRELDELNKGLKDARLATFDAKNKELEEVKLKYDGLKALAQKYGKDTAVIEEARLRENTTIIDKFAKEDKDKADKILTDKLASETLLLDLRLAKGEIKEKEYNDKLYELRKQYSINADDLTKAEVDREKYVTEEKKKSLEEQRDILAVKLQSQVEALDAENAKIEGDYEQDLERLATKRTLLAEQEANELANTELTEFQKTEIRKKYADARTQVTNQEVATEKAAAEAKHAINIAYLGLFEQFGNTLSQLAGKNKALAIAGVVISQAAAIGQIISNTGAANAKAVLASPLTFGQPWVAINTISAALSIAGAVSSASKSISQINQAAAAGGASGGGGGAAAPAQAPPPVYSGAPAATATPEVNIGAGANPTSQIAQTLSQTTKRPIQTYVVASEVSSQQALDRRTNRAATFGGGV
jgi:hypothetical protein